MASTSRIMIDCLCLALNMPGIQPVLPRDIDWDALYSLSAEQKVAQIVGAALRSHPDWDEEGEDFDRIIQESVYHECMRYFEMNEVYEQFEKEGIDFFPFKGVVFKYYYPEPWMRIMNDVDILVKYDDLARVRRILEGRHFSFSNSYSVHDVYSNPANTYRVEIHYKLFSNWSDQNEWDKNIWDKLTPIEPGLHHMAASDKDNFIIYLIHFQKHQMRNMITAQMLVDFWLMPSVKGDLLPMHEIMSLGLEATYNNLDDVTQAWLWNEPLPYRSLEFETFMLSKHHSGVQSKYDREVYYWRLRHVAPHERGIRRVFPPKSQMIKQFPSIESRGWLLVPYWILQFIRRGWRVSTYKIRVAWYKFRGASSAK